MRNGYVMVDFTGVNTASTKEVPNKKISELLRCGKPVYVTNFNINGVLDIEGFACVRRLADGSCTAYIHSDSYKYDITARPAGTIQITSRQ